MLEPSNEAEEIARKRWTMTATEQAELIDAYAAARVAEAKPKATKSDVDLVTQINKGRPVIDGPQGVFVRWDAVMQAVAEARAQERERLCPVLKRTRDKLAVFVEESSDPGADAWATLYEANRALAEQEQP